MKFLVFNIIVAALVYLFSGPEGELDITQKASAAMETVKSKAESIVTAPHEDKPEPQEMATKAPVETKPKVEPVIELANTEPAPLPVVEIPKLEPFTIDPALAVIPDEAPEIPTQTEFKMENDKFMSRQERRQALMQLAEDMEYFSAEAMVK